MSLPQTVAHPEQVIAAEAILALIKIAIYLLGGSSAISKRID